jgi:hypothetical protein
MLDCFPPMHGCGGVPLKLEGTKWCCLTVLTASHCACLVHMTQASRPLVAIVDSTDSQELNNTCVWVSLPDTPHLKHRQNCIWKAHLPIRVLLSLVCLCSYNPVIHGNLQSSTLEERKKH